MKGIFLSLLTNSPILPTVLADHSGGQIMIHHVFFLLLCFVGPVHAQEGLETFPESINVDDYSRAYFIERAGEIASCVEEVPNPDLVLDSDTTAASLVMIQTEYQHCIYMAQAVLTQANDWKGAIQCEKDRQAVASELVVEADSEQDELLVAFNAFLDSYVSGTVTSVKTEPAPEPVPEKTLSPLDQKLVDAEELIEQLDLLLAELELLQAVIQHKIIQLRVEEQLQENLEPFGASL
jgi:hypothetical protein